MHTHEQHSRSWRSCTTATKRQKRKQHLKRRVCPHVSSLLCTALHFFGCRVRLSACRRLTSPPSFQHLSSGSTSAAVCLWACVRLSRGSHAPTLDTETLHMSTRTQERPSLEPSLAQHPQRNNTASPQRGKEGSINAEEGWGDKQTNSTSTINARQHIYMNIHVDRATAAQHHTHTHTHRYMQPSRERVHT